MSKQLCLDIDLYDEMPVIYQNETVTLIQAVNMCKPGETIEGIHPNQYMKLLKMFEEKRGKKFQYSVDIKYGDWRFILFDIKTTKSVKGRYVGKYAYLNDDIKLPDVKPIKLV